MQNTHFSGLTRKNPVFERSVLKYVSIKNRILTPSGQKSRVCVNQPDRLLHPFRVEILSSSRLLTPQKQTGRVNQPKAIICPAGTAFRPSAMLGRLRGARFASPTGGEFSLNCSALRALHSAVRRSWDACAARSKVGPVMGLRPLLGPPCIPPEAPLRRVFPIPWRGEGNAAIAAGASFPRYARSGDLPPRRVNARVRFRSGCESVSAKYRRYVA